MPRPWASGWVAVSTARTALGTVAPSRRREAPAQEHPEPRPAGRRSMATHMGDGPAGFSRCFQRKKSSLGSSGATPARPGPAPTSAPRSSGPARRISTSSAGGRRGSDRGGIGPVCRGVGMSARPPGRPPARDRPGPDRAPGVQSGVSPQPIAGRRPPAAGARHHHRHVPGLAARSPARRPSGAAGYEVIGVSAPGPFVDGLSRAGRAATCPGPTPPGPWPRATTCWPPSSCTASCAACAPTSCTPTTPSPAGTGRPAGPVGPGAGGRQHRARAVRPARRPAGPKRALVYALERTAAAFSDGELVQNPEDVAVLRAPACARRRHPPARQRDRPGPLRPGPLRRAPARPPLARPWAPSRTRSVVGVVGRLVAEKGIAEVLGRGPPAARDHARRCAGR